MVDANTVNRVHGTTRTNGGENFLIISAHHDYRSPNKVDLHFITEQLKPRGKMRFFSLRYSALSSYTADPRSMLDELSNRVGWHDGVECYLWKTPIHPFNTRRPFLRSVENILFWAYVRSSSPVLRRWVREATVIIFESGITPIFFNLVTKINPRAKTIYRASDDLDAHNVADYVKRTLQRIAPSFHAICLPSKMLARNLPATDNRFFVPHGISPDLGLGVGPSPFDDGVHAVSVGSGLFDAGFFIVASQRFPDITFHVIGSGHIRDPGYGNNVLVYGEMPYAETIRYLKHARFGVAPYKLNNGPAYFADTSMKLMQYDFLGLPAVCPWAVVGDFSSRFGYSPEDPDSIETAVWRALQAPPIVSRRYLSWPEVTDRLLEPERFDDTRIDP